MLRSYVEIIHYLQLSPILLMAIEIQILYVRHFERVLLLRIEAREGRDMEYRVLSQGQRNEDLGITWERGGEGRGGEHV